MHLLCLSALEKRYLERIDKLVLGASMHTDMDTQQRLKKQT